MMFHNLPRAPIRKVRRPVYYYPSNAINGNGNIIYETIIATGSSSPSPVHVTNVTTPTYTASVRDYFLCVDHAGLVTITLPFGVLGTVYIVKDCTGNAFTYPITVQGTGQTIDGGTAEIDTNYGSLTFIFNGIEWSIV